MIYCVVQEALQVYCSLLGNRVKPKGLLGELSTKPDRTMNGPFSCLYIGQKKTQFYDPFFIMC